MDRSFFRSTLVTLVSLVGAGSAAAAQTNPLVGSWNLRYAAGARLENGTRTVVTGTGKLIVQLQDDSLIARLIPNPLEGAPARPEARMAAKAGPGEVVFIQRGTARLNMNGEEREVTSISTWTLAATGDQLTGTVARRIEGADVPSAGPEPVTGSRLKG
jgi:hypothetical protein